MARYRNEIVVMTDRDKEEIASDLSQAIVDFHQVDDSLSAEVAISRFTDNAHRVDDLRDERDQKIYAVTAYAEELIDAVGSMK